MFLFREFTLDIKKEVRASLLKIFGVGWYKAYLLTTRMGLSIPFYLVNINSYIFSILFYLLKGTVLGDARLKRIIYSNISLKVDLSSYQGLRHKLSLPCMVREHVQMRVLNVLLVLMHVHWMLVQKIINLLWI